MGDASNEDQSLELLTRLLTAHAALIRETSEDMAHALLEGLKDLRLAIASSSEDGKVPVKLHDQMNDLAAHLQLQDLLRQQVLVLEQGLTSIARARIPEGEDPTEWYDAKIADIMATYVMQQQYRVHSEVLGLPEEEASDEQTSIFF